MPINLKAANWKLAQADYHLAHLRSMSRKIAGDMGRAAATDFRLPLEAFFTACLVAARSCHYVLCKSGGPDFRPIERHWRNNALDEAGRMRFNRMLKLRDDDIHYGETGAETLPKMIAAEATHGYYEAYYHQQRYNAALFGPAPLAEHQNPDGIAVRASTLVGTYGLYVEIGGDRIEASTACEHFIAQLRTLVRAAEDLVAPATTATPALDEPACGAEPTGCDSRARPA